MMCLLIIVFYDIKKIDLMRSLTQFRNEIYELFKGKVKCDIIITIQRDNLKLLNGMYYDHIHNDPNKINALVLDFVFSY